MSYIASTRPDITESLPFALSLRRVATSYTQVGARFDVEVSGLPFMLDPDPSRPYVRETLDSQRQQIDTSRLPGEQTLSQWWTRTQDSWHAGAGLVYYEPGTDEDSINRFGDSLGVDVWTKGQISLLKACPQLRTAAGFAYLTGASVGGNDVFFSNENGVVKRSTPTASTTFTGGTLTPATRVAVCGKKIVVGTSDSLLIGDAGGSTLADMLTASAATYTMVPYWVKSRLVVAHGPDLYDYALSDSALGTPLWGHPDDDWMWTDVTEAPGAILACGYGTGEGSIYRIELTDNSGVPELGAPLQVTTLPRGEYPTAMRVYLGTFLVLGTNKGVRIGVVDRDGNLTLGPLSVETDHAVTALTAQDRFVYAAADGLVNGLAGCVRLDLSQQVEQDLRFAWATDAQTHVAGTVNGLTVLGNTGRLVLGVYGQGIYVQDDAQVEAAGWVTTGRIRYGTTVPKGFLQYNVQASCPGTSTVTVSAQRSDQTSFTYEYTVDNAFDQDQNLQFSTGGDSCQWVDLKLTLAPSADGESSPVLDSVTTLALPHARVQRAIQYPLKCYDKERDANGTSVGYRGAAFDRIKLLEELERNNVLVNIIDRTTGDAFAGLIKRVTFRRTAAPDHGQANFGGVLDLTVVVIQ